MSASKIRERTAEIVGRFHATRDLLADGGDVIVSLEHAERFEDLAAETIRLLRENMTACVREEQATNGTPASGSEAGQHVIDLGYGDAKAEIDTLVKAIVDWKTALRDAKQQWIAPADETPEPVYEASGVTNELVQLTAMYRSGALTADEFTAAKARLLTAGDSSAPRQR